jgi:predicted lysophospholipase L1 biosynthesis ABC-type transport system permease subunit
MKRERVFKVPPSLFALLSGILLSVGIDLFKVVFFTQERLFSSVFLKHMLFSMVSIFVSFLCFLYLSVKLEELRRDSAVKDIPDRIRVSKSLRAGLWSALITGFISLGFTLFLMYLGYIEG